MRKMRLFYKILLNAIFIVSACLFYGCSKDYDYIDQVVKDYCIFEKGSYWIYQDSITKGVDSVLLRQSLLECREVYVEWGRHLDEFYESEYGHYLSDTSIICYSLLDPHRVYHYRIIGFNSGMQDVEKNPILHISFIDFIIPDLDSYSIEKNVFNNVKITLEKNIFNDFTSNYSTKCYWAKDIGLIRYEIYNANNEILNTYNLIRYNVKPYKK